LDRLCAVRAAEIEPKRGLLRLRVWMDRTGAHPGLGLGALSEANGRGAQFLYFSPELLFTGSLVKAECMTCQKLRFRGRGIRIGPCNPHTAVAFFLLRLFHFSPPVVELVLILV
jgi:hypothetical protein